MRTLKNEYMQERYLSCLKNLNRLKDYFEETYNDRSSKNYRNYLILSEFLSTEKTVAQISRDFNLTRPRIDAILDRMLRVGYSASKRLLSPIQENTT